jgi:uncharacterized protein with GYD domain
VKLSMAAMRIVDGRPVMSGMAGILRGARHSEVGIRPALGQAPPDHDARPGPAPAENVKESAWGLTERSLPPSISDPSDPEPFSSREAHMPKYLFQISYTAQGAKGVLADGGSKRRAAAEQAAKSVGGKLESFYFAFGDTDAFVVADAPDHGSAAAVSMAVSASGAAQCKTIVLLTPEELDQTGKKPLTYSPPGR